jgi:acyl-CoA synthetase (AMP-forming)/AMP-acid ligase II/acyl carrier protein
LPARRKPSAAHGKGRDVVKAISTHLATGPSFVAVLRRRAATEPDRVAYWSEFQGKSGGQALTYGALDRRARSLAVAIREQAAPGDRALLLFPSGLEFLTTFCGCLYAGVIAVPMFPPRPNRGLARLESILEDSGARLALTASPSSSFDSRSRWSGLRYLDTDEVDPSSSERWEALPTGSHDVAYLQYTSGSTSAPRGVKVSHDNLLYNCAYMREVFGLSPETVSVTWAPHFHDMGLIEGLLNPLYTGYPAVLLSPAEFIARPVRWLEAISRHRATHSGAPNFAYDLCVDRVSVEKLAALDLASWTCAYSGAEPVRAATLERFAAHFAPCGFRRESLSPGYGLAEATLMVSGSEKSQPVTLSEIDVFELERGRALRAERGARARTIVACGRPRFPTRVAIVDPRDLRTLPERAIGEIWVGGPTVAQGYWNQPELTALTFSAFTSDTNEGPFLRTGDLGFVADGELFLTGRLKDFVIVRGANVYLQDIDWAAGQAHPALRPAGSCALSVDDDGREALVLVLELERGYQRAEARELEEIVIAVRRVIAEEFDLRVDRVQLVKTGSLLKTSSGKLQRQACRESYLRGEGRLLFDSPLERREPSSPITREDLLRATPRERRHAIEKHLRREVGRALGIPWLHIDSNQPLGRYGLASLQGSELVARLEDLLGLRLPATMVYNYPTVADISAFLSDRMAPQAAAARSERSAIELSELAGELDRLSEVEMERVPGSGRSRIEGSS